MEAVIEFTSESVPIASALNCSCARRDRGSDWVPDGGSVTRCAGINGASVRAELIDCVGFLEIGDGVV